MPHFGLMDMNKLGPVEALLMRAKLHMRAGKRRLQQGKISSGIVTLYDALAYAMDWFMAVPERKSQLMVREEEDLKSEKTLYAVLVRSGVLDGAFDYEAFDALVDRASESDRPEHMKDYDYSGLLAEIESVMTQLGVIPFDENTLPPEDPTTF